MIKESITIIMYRCKVFKGVKMHVCLPLALLIFEVEFKCVLNARKLKIAESCFILPVSLYMSALQVNLSGHFPLRNTSLKPHN